MVQWPEPVSMRLFFLTFSPAGHAMVNNTRHEETWIQRLRLVQNVTESGATKVISSQPSGTDLL